MTDECPAYSRTAAIYDELVGEGLFEAWKENFQRLQAAFKLPLKVCADVACGTGMAARFLAECGARVYAVDISPQMLEEAERRTRGLKVELLRQDLRQLALPEKVDLLTCNADSLNYLLEEGELLLSLARFRENLRPGGYAVFDVNTPYQLMGQEDGATWEMRLGDMRMYWRSRYDLGSGIATLEMRHVEEGPDGELCYREVHRERGYGKEDVESALREAGFSNAWCWDAAGLVPVSDGTRRLQFLART